jgi:hypothetical protein
LKKRIKKFFLKRDKNQNRGSNAVKRYAETIVVENITQTLGGGVHAVDAKSLVELVQCMQVGENDVACDIGCGTGQLALAVSAITRKPVICTEIGHVYQHLDACMTDYKKVIVSTSTWLEEDEVPQNNFSYYLPLAKCIPATTSRLSKKRKKGEGRSRGNDVESDKDESCDEINDGEKNRRSKKGGSKCKSSSSSMCDDDKTQNDDSDKENLDSNINARRRGGNQIVRIQACDDDSD